MDYKCRKDCDSNYDVKMIQLIVDELCNHATNTMLVKTACLALRSYALASSPGLDQIRQVAISNEVAKPHLNWIISENAALFTSSKAWLAGNRKSGRLRSLSNRISQGFKDLKLPKTPSLTLGRKNRKKSRSGSTATAQ